MKISKTDPERTRYGVRFHTHSGRPVERFFETDEDRTLFLTENDYAGESFTDPER